MDCEGAGRIRSHQSTTRMFSAGASALSSLRFSLGQTQSCPSHNHRWKRVMNTNGFYVDTGEPDGKGCTVREVLPSRRPCFPVCGDRSQERKDVTAAPGTPCREKRPECYEATQVSGIYLSEADDHWLERLLVPCSL